MILELLHPSVIQVGVKAQDWREAGQIAGELLIKSEGVQPQYINAMIKAVEEIGPYIVIAPGVAMFHGRPEDGVNNICVSFVTLQEGVDFGAGDKDPVRLVIALGAKDNNSHLDLLREMIAIIGDSELVQRIIEASSQEEVIKLIANKLSDGGKENVI